MEIRDRLKRPETRYLLIIVLLSLLPRLIYYFYLLLSPQGLPTANDTEWYMKHARALLHGFNVSMHYNGIFYIGYYGLLAIMLLIFKTQAAVVFVQMVINALTVVLVYSIGEMLFNRRTAVIAALFYAFTWPLIYWSIFIISDSLFISLLLLNVYFLVSFYKKHKRKYFLFFIFSSAYMVFFRPTGIITLTFIAVYIIINMNFKRFKAIFNRKRLIILGTLVLAAAAVLYAVHRSGMLKPLYTSFYWSMYWLLFEVYSNGQIFDVVTRYDYHFNAIKTVNYFDSFLLSYFINNWQNIMVLFAKKSVYFWAVSFKHFTLVKLYFAAAYLAGAAGIVGIFRNSRLRDSSIVILVMLSIQVFCVIFFIDSAFRYRVPALVFLNFLAAYGVDFLLRIGSKVYYRIKEAV